MQLPQNAKEKAAFRQMLKSWQRAPDDMPLAPCADPIVIDCCWPPSLLQSVLHKVQAMPGCLLVFYADEGMPTCNDAPFTE